MPAQPLHILFVCLGNICRSCTAEEIFRTRAEAAGAGEYYIIDSAGLIDYHEGELPDSRMRAAARRRGYELTHRSRPVRPEDYDRFDLIVAMDDSNLAKLTARAPTPAHRDKIVLMGKYLPHSPGTKPVNVPDPYYGAQRDFDAVVTMLEEACDGLLRVTLPDKG